MAEKAERTSIHIYDIFVSYASEDQDQVKILVEALQKQGIKVWWDQIQIMLGDKLSEKIGEGLRKSRYGLVIISEPFIDKEGWSENELGNLLNQSTKSGQKKILPVRLGISHEKLSEKYAFLADIKTAEFGSDINLLIDEILRAIKQQEETPHEETDVTTESSDAVDQTANSQRAKEFQKAIKRQEEIPHEEIGVASENSDADDQIAPRQRHVVFLIHGMRTQAEWARKAANILDSDPSITVAKPIRYGFFDIFRFLAPGHLFRQKPIDRIKKFIRQERSDGSTDLSVIAHSFGTYIIGKILEQESDIKLYRLILCGSILSDDFEWDKLENQLLSKNSERLYVVNDCGNQDKWPVFAKFVTFGYGSSGRFGFGDPLVRDRYFDEGHSGYFKESFIKKYWLPYLVDGTINEGTLDKPSTPWWLNVLTILKLPYIILILVLFVLSILFAVSKFPQFQNCIRSQNQSMIQCLKNHVFFAKVPNAPELQATGQDGQVLLKWQAGSENGPEVSEWQYRFRINDGDGTWSDNWIKIDDSNSSTTSHLVSDLVNGTEYLFQIKAVNRVGDGEASDGFPTMPIGVPDAPNIEAFSMDSEVRLEWNAGSNNGAEVVKWQYRQSDDDGNNWSPDWTDIPSSSLLNQIYIVSDLTPGDKYTFQMRAVNSVGDGEASDKISAMSIGVFVDCNTCPEMVVIPAGSFTMGSPPGEEGRDNNEGPQHQVTIAKPFGVGKYEVTRGEYKEFVDETKYKQENTCWESMSSGPKNIKSRNWQNPGFDQDENHPVVCVSWEDASAYVDWLSNKTGKIYLLLSESEWEYVARDGTITARYWEESSEEQCNHANGADLTVTQFDDDLEVASCEDSYYRTAPVGSFKKNKFGLHDVLGNVLEWTQDCLNDSYTGAPGDGRAWETGECGRRVLRGGSWFSKSKYLRSAYRRGRVPIIDVTTAVSALPGA